MSLVHTAATFLQTPSAVPSGDIGQELIDQAAGAFEEWEKATFSVGLINTLILAGVVALITFIIIRLLNHFLAKKMKGNMKIFYRLMYLLIIIVAASIVLMTITPLKNFGTTILASSGIAAVVIGLAAQQTLGNIFSGMSISASKPFEVGEFIEILNTNPVIMGVVKEIGLRHTVIRDASNKDVVIPNSVLDKEMLRTSHTLDEMSINNALDINISYTADIDKAIQIIEGIVRGHGNTLDVRSKEDKENGVPAVVVRIADLGDWAIRLRVFVWTKDIATGFVVLSDLRYEIKKAFDKNGIEIPYPYQNVIYKNAPPDGNGMS